MKLNVGSGSVRIEGLVNVDFYPGAQPDVVADVRALPFEDGSIEEIFASHVLEHFDYWDTALQEWHRVLQDGGVLWVLVPDVFEIYNVAIAGNGAYQLEEGNWQPMDLGYVNAAVFGGHLLGPPYDRAGHVHRQIFIGEMLPRQLANFFSDIEKVTECPYREVQSTEQAYRAVKRNGRRAATPPSPGSAPPR